MAKKLDITNINGMSTNDDVTCSVNDMNCVDGEEKTCGVTDMNCVDEKDSTCGVTDMNCLDEIKK